MSMINKNSTYPTHVWNVGDRRFRFTDTPNLQVGCGGTEVPVPWGGKTYLYCWDAKDRVHTYYCFEEDLIVGEIPPWDPSLNPGGGS